MLQLLHLARKLRILRVSSPFDPTNSFSHREFKMALALYFCMREGAVAVTVSFLLSGRKICVDY